ncbi:UNVERIFIED_CONTAM: putative mitochondrial protein [Sesamum latifolium]|uniref:Mitochondrial protein n=1 Tax=Sesamum latifolium TaxID=2727402 RepID=A0AAW2TQ12_9LAMI
MYLWRRLWRSPANRHENLNLKLSGTGAPWTVRSLMELIKVHSPGLVFLSETKCKSRRVEQLKEYLNYNGIGVDSCGKGGGLLLLWRKDIDVWIQSFSAHHIDTTVKINEFPDTWRFTGFYGHPDASKWKTTWNLLRQLRQLSSRPWLCVGDFNEILHHYEKEEGNLRAKWQIDDFRQCLTDCELNDLGYKGYHFTWWNRREEPNTVQARLDRAVCSDTWADSFPAVQVYQEHNSASDHGVLWVDLQPTVETTPRRNKRLFRFEAAWTKVEECDDIITQSWTTKIRGNGSEMLLHKIKECQINLLRWNRESFGNIVHQISERRQKKEIKRLRDEQGSIVVGENQIRSIITDYFSRVFQTSTPNANAIKSVLDVVEPRVSIAMNDSLLQPYTSDEVSNALKQMHPYKSPGPDGHVALKLDVSKAYDRVEWPFLESVLSKIGFHQKVVSLIMLCVTSVTYSFLLNGTQFGYLKPGRGLRQGDPLSPYLYLFCAEAFSGLIRQAENTGQLQGVAAASGLRISVQKSAMVVSKNVARDWQEELASILGVQLVQKHDKYLGLPTIVGKSKREVFSSLKERIWQKLNNWASKKLSQAGRAILIKTVTQAIPTYVMGCFSVPESLLTELEGLMAKFFWHGELDNKIHWLSWSKLCRSRTEGGLGFRRLKEFNTALLAKQAWRIATRDDTLLHQIFKQRYFPGSNFFAATTGSKPSYTWRSLLRSRDLLTAGTRWRIGDGQTARIVGEPWLPRPHTFQLIMKPRTLHCGMKVATLMDAEQRWNENLIREEFRPTDAECILSIPLREGTRDEIVWHYEKKGTFSVRSAYELTKALTNASCSVSATDWKFLWKARVPPKIKMFAWRGGMNALPTLENLKRRGLELDITCSCCGVEPENLSLVLFQCTFSRLVWAISNIPWSVLEGQSDKGGAWLQEIHGQLDSGDFALFLCICWGLWMQGNKRLFEGSSGNADEVINLAHRQLLGLKSALTFDPG